MVWLAGVVVKRVSAKVAATIRSTPVFCVVMLARSSKCQNSIVFCNTLDLLPLGSLQGNQNLPLTIQHLPYEIQAMKRSIKTAVVAVATVASLVANTVPVSACGGSGGGFSRPQASVSYARPAYSQPSYSQPAYSQPSYSQPSYSQPAYEQAAYAQPVYSQPTYSQPVYASSAPVQSQPATTTIRPAAVRPSTVRPAAVAQAPVQNPVAQNPVAQNPAAQNPAAQNPAAQNNVTQAAPKTPAQVPTQSAAPKSAESNALALLASIASKPAKGSEPAPTSTATAASSIPQFSAPAKQTAAGDHVGTWKVDLPGQQSVTLTMDAAGKFVWTATKAGKTNQFDGQYRISGGRLTLVRSADLQQMNGSWTAAKNGFVFKLDGATTGGLNFQRS